VLAGSAATDFCALSIRETGGGGGISSRLMSSSQQSSESESDIESRRLCLKQVEIMQLDDCTNICENKKIVNVVITNVLTVWHYYFIYALHEMVLLFSPASLVWKIHHDV